LISREDNARISAATLRAMARRLLNSDALPARLEDQLTKLCEADPMIGKEIAARLLTPDHDDSTELSELRKSKRFCWWARTFAHSSVIVVLFRSPVQRRMLIKLSYQERIKAKQRALTRLGWAAYRVGVDSSLFEARSSHFEAEAPRGLRILTARLSDMHRREPATERGFLRRVHLYRPRAHAVNAATAVLWLVVSGGFLGGALLAAALGFGALVACAIAAESIAENPTREEWRRDRFFPDLRFGDRPGGDVHTFDRPRGDVAAFAAGDRFGCDLTAFATSDRPGRDFAAVDSAFLEDVPGEVARHDDAGAPEFPGKPAGEVGLGLYDADAHGDRRGPAPSRVRLLVFGATGDLLGSISSVSPVPAPRDSAADRGI
jgi:hypothetical protein